MSLGRYSRLIWLTPVSLVPTGGNVQGVGKRAFVDFVLFVSLIRYHQGLSFYYRLSYTCGGTICR